jgi:hypothetical protein
MERDAGAPYAGRQGGNQRSWWQPPRSGVTTLLVLGAVMLLCFGALLGASWTTQVLGGVSRRHAAERRMLNEGWRALEDARRGPGRTPSEPVYCARCHQRVSESSWLLAVPALTDEEDDGT